MQKKQRRTRERKACRETTFFPTQHLGAPLLLDNEDDDVTETPALSAELKAAILKKVALHKRRDAQSVHADVKVC